MSTTTATTTALIEPQLNSITGSLKNVPPAIRDTLMSARQEVSAAFDPSKAVKLGDRLPSFSLPDATGQTQTLSNLLSARGGPLILTFYRGSWCPYCNIALSGFQKHLPALEAAGATLVAITPEQPDGTLSSIEKHELRFAVLTDAHNAYARTLGLVSRQPDALKPVFEHFGTDLKKHNGDDSFELPIPATLLIDKEGVVRNLHADPDWTKRVEPSKVLDWVKAL